jgi:gas vesicle protein
MSRDNEFANFLAGFIIGGRVGAATALLMAPQSGEETRAVIKEKSIELKDKAVLTAEDARVRAENARDDARVRAEEAVAEVRTRADEVARLSRERATELGQKGQILLDESKSKVRQTVKKAAKDVEDAAGDAAEAV